MLDGYSAHQECVCDRKGLVLSIALHAYFFTHSMCVPHNSRAPLASAVHLSQSVSGCHCHRLEPSGQLVNIVSALTTRPLGPEQEVLVVNHRGEIVARGATSGWPERHPNPPSLSTPRRPEHRHPCSCRCFRRHRSVIAPPAISCFRSNPKKCAASKCATMIQHNMLNTGLVP